jgi:hypothetical protein
MEPIQYVKICSTETFVITCKGALCHNPEYRNSRVISNYIQPENYVIYFSQNWKLIRTSQIFKICIVLVTVYLHKTDSFVEKLINGTPLLYGSVL